ncbi:MAG: hypothetical protein NTU73_02065, partial [Ignavibacteriae bacterium]|nr:hypothetical protein [Ignavibacteriota bacterium]
MNLALTYNVKKETEEEITTSAREIKNSVTQKYINSELVENYPERIDDTFAEWDSMETIDAVKSAL